MNRVTILVAIVLGGLCLSTNVCYAWPEPPDVRIYDWVRYVGPDEEFEFYAEDYSGTDIQYWWWDYPSGSDLVYEDDYGGPYGCSWAGFTCDSPGIYYFYATAENDYDLTDDDWGEAVVVQVTIDDCPAAIAYQPSTSATIDFTLEPVSSSYRHYAWLYIKNSSGQTIRSYDLGSGTGDLGSHSRDWDGKDSNGNWAPAGLYTVTVELHVGPNGSIVFSDSCTITVVQATIDSAEAFFYQSTVPADITYTIAPADALIRPLPTLLIKSGSTTIRTLYLEDEMGTHTPTWDGKKEDTTWALPGLYTATVQVDLGSTPLTSSPPVPEPVVGLTITPPFPRFIQVNDDDDAGEPNGVKDMKQSGPFPSDDGDIAFGTFTWTGPGIEGACVSVYWSSSEAANPSVWSDRKRTSVPTLPLYASLDTPLSMDLAFEGWHFSHGAALDPFLISEFGIWDYPYYYHLGDQRTWMTVILVGLDLDGIADNGDYNETAETMPGGFMRLNESKELTAHPVLPSSAAEYWTLEEGYVYFPDPVWRKMQLDVVYAGSGRIDVNDPNGNPITTWPYTFYPSTDAVFTVKATHTSSAARDITLVLTHDKTGFTDEIKLTVAKVDLSFDGVADANEENPGAYITVNWSDDDGDGWDPNETPPNASYTPDKDDPNVYHPTKAPNGDRDLRPLTVSIEPAGLPGKVRLTYSGGIAVWGTRTKRKPPDTSSSIASGTEFDANGLPIQVFVEGVSGSTTFRDGELRATYLPCDANDVIKVTVFEVNLTGFFGYGNEQDDDQAKFRSPFLASSDHTGMISWDDANADGTKGDYDPNCQYFHNCMECQGTVEPLGVTNEVQFDFVRDKWERLWLKPGGGSWTLEPPDNTNPWRSDSSTGPGYDKDLSVSNNNHIYYIDGPGLRYNLLDWGKPWHNMAHIADFRQYAIVNIGGAWYQCSNVYKWHSKIYIEPKDSTYATRSAMSQQALGGGWITVPDNP